MSIINIHYYTILFLEISCKCFLTLLDIQLLKRSLLLAIWPTKGPTSRLVRPPFASLTRQTSRPAFGFRFFRLGNVLRPRLRPAFGSVFVSWSSAWPGSGRSSHSPRTELPSPDGARTDVKMRQLGRWRAGGEALSLRLVLFGGDWFWNDMGSKSAVEAKGLLFFQLNLLWNRMCQLSIGQRTTHERKPHTSWQTKSHKPSMCSPHPSCSDVRVTLRSNVLHKEPRQMTGRLTVLSVARECDWDLGVSRIMRQSVWDFFLHHLGTMHPSSLWRLHTVVYRTSHIHKAVYDSNIYIQIYSNMIIWCVRHLDVEARFWHESNLPWHGWFSEMCAPQNIPVGFLTDLNQCLKWLEKAWKGEGSPG